jgi:hypothetical protein
MNVSYMLPPHYPLFQPPLPPPTLVTTDDNWPSHGPHEGSAEGEGRKRVGWRERGVEKERRRKRKK